RHAADRISKVRGSAPEERQRRRKKNRDKGVLPQRVDERRVAGVDNRLHDEPPLEVFRSRSTRSRSFSIASRSSSDGRRLPIACRRSALTEPPYARWSKSLSRTFWVRSCE